jgi:carbamate kinase
MSRPLLAHVVVDPADAAMRRPTKPIGPFLTESEANRLAHMKGWNVESDSGRGYRRVVPSPQPQSIVEVDAVRCLLDSGHVVVTAGGGGIPGFRADSGGFVGVDAVIDKDYVAAALAMAIGAQALVIVTAVEAVQVDFGTATPRRLGQIDVAQAEAHLAAGQFPGGQHGPPRSARPRDSCAAAARSRVITSPALAAGVDAVYDPADVTVGTRIVRTGSPSRTAQ